MNRVYLVGFLLFVVAAVLYHNMLTHTENPKQTENPSLVVLRTTVVTNYSETWECYSDGTAKASQRPCCVVTLHAVGTSDGKELFYVQKTDRPCRGVRVQHDNRVWIREER